jgi:hypothetical protein
LDVDLRKWKTAIYFVKLVRKRIKHIFSGSLEKQSLTLFPFYYDNFSNLVVKFLHFKVLGKPRTLKCETENFKM